RSRGRDGGGRIGADGGQARGTRGDTCRVLASGRPAGRGGGPRSMSAPTSATTARGLALDALVRIEDGAYANLVLPTLLGGSGLSSRDRAFTTDLVYGTTRMRRACDWLLGP